MNDHGYLWLGLGGVIAACWGQVRSLLLKLWSLAFVRVRLRSGVGDAVAMYCYRKFRRSPFGLLTFAGDYWFVRPRRRFQVVAFEVPSREPMVFWKGWRPVFLTAAVGSQKEGTEQEGSTVTVTVLRGTMDVEQMVIEALEMWNAVHFGPEQGMAPGQRRFAVYRKMGMGLARGAQGNGVVPGGAADPKADGSVDAATRRLLQWKQEEVGPELAEGRALDGMYFPPEVREMVEEVRRWRASEGWYRERGIAWRRGWLLHGKPGTGKTSLVRAVAQDEDLPVFVLDLATMDNRELCAAWMDLRNCTPCVALIEDVDAVFDGRKNMTTGDEGGGLTFDCLLNCISGVEGANGVFLVVTTNRRELLDEALTRPGRVDREMELRAMDEENRRRLGARVLSDCLWELEGLVLEGEGDTSAEFQERCARVALAAHWDSGAGLKALLNGHRTPEGLVQEVKR